MGTVHVTYQADRDIKQISEFIARDKPIAAEQWLDTIHQTCERLAEFPEMGERHPEVKIPDCRLFTVGDYVIFYQPVSNGVAIARVLHGSQNWRR